MRISRYHIKPLIITVLVLYLVLLGFLSLMPNPPEPPQMFSWDKLEHALAYSVLAVLCFMALPTGLSTLRRLSYAAVISCGTGAFFEILQGVLDLGRFFEWFDLLANMVGTLVGLLLVCLVLVLSRENNCNGC